MAGYHLLSLNLHARLPGASPEPAAAAAEFAEEGVIVYPIAIGNGGDGIDPDTLRAFNLIAEKTGGKVFTAEKADGVVDAILDILEEVGGDPETSQGADLALAASAAPQVAPTGSDLTYSFTAMNVGAVNAVDVALTALRPTGVALRSADAPACWSCAGPDEEGVVICAAPALAAGESVTINLTATIDCALPGGASLDAPASINSAAADPDPVNNFASADATASNPAPLMGTVSPSLTELWPANHKMVGVALDYAVTDNCGEPANTLSVTSNEPVNGNGDGDTAPDWEIIDAHQVRLRAERDGGGAGRVYTVTVTSTDSAGNSSSRSVMVRVPKSRGR